SGSPICHRSRIALSEDTLPMVFRTRFQPYSLRPAFQKLPRFWIGNDRATGGDDDLFVASKKFQQKVVGEPLVISFAVQRKQFSERKIRFFFNQGIQLQKGNRELFRQRLSNGRFARATESD